MWCIHYKYYQCFDANNADRVSLVTLLQLMQAIPQFCEKKRFIAVLTAALQFSGDTLNMYQTFCALIV